MDEIIKDLSKKLKITTFETKKIITQVLNKETYQEELFELLGFENIEVIGKICENKELFKEQEDEGENNKFYVEFCLPEFNTIEVEESDLLSTDYTGEEAKYFEYSKFNSVQSQVFNCAYKSDSNFLVCAPTGSGKTDVALLAILRALKKEEAKIVYIVPMKALACEITHKYRFKLKNHTVVEFTGDTEISNKELLKSNLIICTPEKFDAYTRKLNNIFQDFLNLVVIDEIHILQDDRGSVLEAIVARIFRYIELKQKHIRIIGLSATLPNFEDVGSFLKTNNIFNFDQRYRPVPLKTSIIGIYQNTTRKQSDKLFIDRINNFRRHDKQVLVFVNTRHDTLNTAKMLINLEYTSDLDKKIKLNDSLEYILSHKIGIHHAGLPRNIRLYMENKFKRGEIDILVCTSTLAWGVNLPAHAVVIKGTLFYDPNIGKFRDLGILDVYQIFGRAGRPQYKITGEAILITEYKKVGEYLRMIKNNQDVESRLLRHVANLINSEIYLNSINSISDGLSWFRNTFMYVRIKKNPSLYGLAEKDINDEDTVLSEYIYLTIKRLEECGLITLYRKDTDTYTLWRFYSTEFGRISSFYYLDHETIFDWLKSVEFISTDEEIIKLILINKDFSNIQLRKDEEYNLSEMASNMDIVIDKTDEFKLYVLTMAHIKKYPVANFALKCDLAYISKNVERILSAFIEFLMYLKMWNLLEKSLYIFSKILPKYRGPIPECNYNVSLVTCGLYLKIEVNSENIKGFWVILYDTDFPFYISKGYKALSTFIKYPFSANIRVKIFDISRNKFYEGVYAVKKDETIESLLRNGYHYCNNQISLLDLSSECKHVKMVNEFTRKQVNEEGKVILSGKYSINVDFFISYISSYQEFLKQFVTISLKYLKNKNPLLIICRSKLDYRLLSQEISTRLALENFETGKGTSKKIIHNVKKITKNSICIVTMEEALVCTENIFTIFLTCQDNSNIFYPIYDILQVCHRKTVLIYENNEFIDYFKNYILRENE